MLSKEKFYALFSGLCDIVGKEPSKTLFKVYYEVLKHLTDEEFETAINKLLTSWKFKTLPMPAEILEMVNGNLEDQAILALTKVERAIREIGPYQTVVFDDPIIHAVINAFDGGWTGICSMTLDEWKFAKKDFIKIYKAYASNPDKLPEIPNKLIGLHEHNNALNGYHKHIPLPVFVGNKEKAKEIYSGRYALKGSQAIKEIMGKVMNKLTAEG